MTRPGVEVRRVGPEAAADVLSVVRRAFGARAPLDPPAAALGDDLDSTATMLAGRGGLLATLDGVPAGSLVLDPSPEGLFLRRFGVAPEAQGRGVATALLDAARDAALGRPALVVVAREELPATIAFWERHGFVEHHRTGHDVELRLALEQAYVAPQAADMRTLGAGLGRSLVPGDLVVLTGELGAGKTTFTQGLGEGLGVRGQVSSPTFVITRVHPSLTDGPDLVHADAYRLGGVEELDDLDLDASLDAAVTVVEWGAGLAEAMSGAHLDVVIERALGGDIEDQSGDQSGDQSEHQPDDQPDGGPDPRRISMRWVVGK